MRPLTEKTKLDIKEHAAYLHQKHPTWSVKELVHKVVEDLKLRLESGQKDQVNREIRQVQRQTGQLYEVPEECVFSFMML